MPDRIVVLVDMDCFYCQVETRLNPSLKGKPVAVVQYNEWQGGGIIAVNYEARACGVTRFARGNEAKKICPDINLVHVPSIRGKADLTRYRDAGREVVDVLCRFCDVVQRASVDEAYLDITQEVECRWKELKGNKVKLDQLPNTFVVGFSPEGSNDEGARKEGLSLWLDGVYQNELQDDSAERLAVAALFIEEVRAAVYESTGFRCSAGIAHNKILAKLACGLHKPQRQTLLPPNGVPVLYRTLPVKKIRGLGGKFGELVSQKLGATYMGDLEQYSESYLQKIFDVKSGRWLFNLARGIDDEPVTARLKSKSIGCCKKFPGKLALGTKETVEHWLGELAAEVIERLDQEMSGGRRATQMVVSYMQTINGQDVSSSRCGPLTSNSQQQLIMDALELLRKSNCAPTGSPLWVPPLKFLGLSVGKFIEKEEKTKTIDVFFKAAAKKSVISDDITKLKSEDPNDILEGCELCEIPDPEDHKTPGPEVHKTESWSEDLEANCKSENYRMNGSVENNKSSSSRVLREGIMKSGGRNSLSKQSFFVNFFKKEGLVESPNLKKKSNFPENHESKIVHMSPSGASQTASTSGIKCNKALKENLSLSDSSNDFRDASQMWVSPREIFPDLDNVDAAVAALFPSPFQRELQTRVEKHLKTKEEHSSLQGRRRSKRSLKYDVVETVEEEEEISCDGKSGISEEALAVPNSCDSDHLQSEDNSEAEQYSKCASQDIFANSTPEEMHRGPEVSDAKCEQTVCGVPVRNSKEEEEESIPDENSVKPQIEEENISHLSPNASNIEKDEIIKEQCVHCKLLIPLQDYPEHLDFHVAAELDHELNKTGNEQQISSGFKDYVLTSGRSPRKDAGKRKRSRPNGKQPSSTCDKKLRSITTFFARVE